MAEGWTLEWNGPEFQARINRAAGRAVIGLAVAVSVETKKVTHVIHGTLRRSVHAAPIGYEGDDEDLHAAETEEQGGIGRDLLFPVPPPTTTPLGPAVEVGSWLPYACVEWIGRGHPGITQGLEMVRGAHADSIVQRAFREEGL